MILLMVLNHCQAWLGWFNTQKSGYFSGAAGLVFFSGLVAAISYSKLPRNQYRRVDKRILRRLKAIWLTHSILAVTLLLICYIVGSKATRHWPWSTLPHDEPFFIALFKLGSMVYQSNFMDVLPLYFACLLMTPLIVRLINAGRSFWVFCVSMSLWLLAQMGVGLPELVHFASFGMLKPSSGLFNLLAWQLIFISGLLIGLSRVNIHLSRQWLRDSLLAFSLLCAGFLYLLSHAAFWYQTSAGFRAIAPQAFLNFVSSIHNQYDLSALASKAEAAPLFLFNFAVVSFIVWQATTRLPMLFRSYWIELLGKNSLPVFGLHILVVYLSYLYPPAAVQATIFSQLAYVLLLLCSVVIPVALTEWRYQKRRRVSHIATGTPAISE